MSQWVQHISGNGEKWEVEKIGEGNFTWRVKNHHNDFLFCYLPKSEYCLVPGPEVWRDVTSDCTILANRLKFDLPNQATDFENYRLRKIQYGAFCWAFIVEKKEQP